MNVTRLSLVACLGVLAACANTERELLTSQIALRQSAVEESSRLLQVLQQSGGSAGGYDYRLYLALAPLNRALAVLDNTTVEVPDLGATVTWKGATIERFGVLPAMTLSGSAVRDRLSVEVVASAVLVPTAILGELKPRILSFTPRVSWSRIEFTKAKFVRDLLAVELSKFADKLPAIVLPLNQALVLGGPSYTSDIRFQVTNRPAVMTARIVIPSTAWTAKLQNVRYFFLRDGVYVFGDLQ